MAVVIGLDYKPLSVSDLFNHDSYYMVPRYQRGYSWGSEQVRELLDDLLESFNEYNDEAYLLGQIIVCPTQTKNSDIDQQLNQWDLIDGQQRCTTLYLLLLVGAKILEEKPAAQQSEHFKFRLNLLGMQTKILNKSDSVLPRIRLASDGQEFVLNLLHNRLLEPAQSPTQKNLESALEEIDTFLRRNFSENPVPVEVDKFIDYVIYKVCVVSLALSTDTQAMRVFQKVNNRGLTLDDADLIKNYLFQKVKSERDYDNLAKMWDSSTNTIFGARLRRVQSMEFLMKALIGIRTGESVPTSKLYHRWEKLLKTEDDVHQLASVLPESARHLVRISKSHIPQNDQKTDLSYGTHMQSWIQQFEILLAGSKMEVPEYEILLKMVEDRTMLSYWAKEPSQDFERIIHPWSRAVSSLGTKPSREDIFATADEALANFSTLSDAAFRGIVNLSYSVESHRNRIRYVLARVNQSFQKPFEVNLRPLREYMQTSTLTEYGYDLDHIFPKSQGQRAAWVPSKVKDEKFGSEDRSEKIINSIGNLVLLYNIPNTQQGDALPWEAEKLKNLGSGQLYANSILTEKEYWPHYKLAATKLTEAQEKFKPEAHSWTEDSVDRRAEFYWSVLSNQIKENFNLL